MNASRYADFGKTIVLTTERSQIAFFPLSLSAVFNCRSLLNKAAYLAALRRLRSPFAIRDANSKQSKTKIYETNRLLLRISAVIGRYGRSRNFRPTPLPRSVPFDND